MVIVDGCLVTIVVLTLDKLVLWGTLNMVFLIDSTTVVVAVVAGLAVSLSESERSELLKLLLPLPSVFFATVVVGVAAACCCCCFSNGKGILITRESGAGVIGV